MEELHKFIERLERIGIIVSLGGNVPWVYIEEINNQKVTERFQANHGFTLGYTPIKKGGVFTFSDISEIFKLIRMYIK